jgi:hypothetical protein
LDLAEITGGTPLEDDKYTGQTFGKHGQLTIVGWLGYYRSNKVYILHCKQCSKDAELYGEGYFKGMLCNLNKGCEVCGCSKAYIRSAQQQEVICKRQANEMDITFNGFVGGYKGKTITRVSLECNRHGSWETSTDCFLGKRTGCPQCKYERISERRLIPEEVLAGKCIEVSNNAGYKFLGWKGEYLGVRSFVMVECPIHGEWTSTNASDYTFKQNSCPRCMVEQNATKLRSNEEELVSRFLATGSFVEGTKFSRLPDLGGPWEVYCPRCETTNISSLGSLSKGYPPCKCSSQYQTKTYLVLLSDNNLPVALKFGISVDPWRRALEYEKRCTFDTKLLGVWDFPDKNSCLSAERSCRSELVTGIISKEEMKDGYTETTSPLNVERIIKIYEQHGGKKSWSNPNLLI